MSDAAVSEACLAGFIQIRMFVAAGLSDIPFICTCQIVGEQGKLYFLSIHAVLGSLHGSFHALLLQHPQRHPMVFIIFTIHLKRKQI